MHRFGFLLFTFLLTQFTALANKQDLSKQIWLGQIYPSGHVYLKNFGDEPQKWDKKMLRITSPHLPKTMTAKFLKEQGSKIVDNVVRTIYIPNFELMDETHDGCGEPKKKRNPNFKYVGGPDFFNSMMDHCEDTKNIGVFDVGQTSTTSSFVIGFDPILGDAMIKSLKGKRAASVTETEVIKKQQADLKDQDYECSTEPAYIDSADLLLALSFSNSDFSIQLSRYSTPGCGGHLATIYVMDTIQGQKVHHTYTLVQYEGVI